MQRLNISYKQFYITLNMINGSMKVIQMPPVHTANLVANSGNTAYGVDIIMQCHLEVSTVWLTPLHISLI